jgi:hypothetical protein
MENPNKYLFDCFNAEKKRHPDMSIYYRKKSDNNDASIRYMNEEGVLTVLFSEQGNEDFYFRRPNDIGIGELVQRVSDNGRYGIQGANFLSLPVKFRNIAQAYQYDRASLHIDEREAGLKKNLKKSAYERD